MYATRATMLRGSPPEKTAEGQRTTYDGAQPLTISGSLFPEDAVARIFRPSRSVATSHPAHKDWKLVFEMRSPPFIDPLLGFTGGKDTLQQVKLRFPTLDSAIQYAERQGLRYRVWPAESEANPATRVDAAA